MQVSSPEHFLPEEGRGDARPQHGGGSDQWDGRHQSGQSPPDWELELNNINILSLSYRSSTNLSISSTKDWSYWMFPRPTSPYISMRSRILLRRDWRAEVWLPSWPEYWQWLSDSSGKVLVNCQKGVSRSSAAVLAYLMLRHQMTAVQALVEVRRGRRRFFLL